MKRRTYRITCVAAPVLAVTVLYLLCAYVAANFNVMEWPSPGRLAHAALTVVALLWVAAVLDDVWVEPDTRAGS